MVDRLFERLLKRTRGLQQKTGEHGEGSDAGQEPPSRTGGDGGAPDRAGAARRPQVGQEQSELDVQVSKFDIARTAEVAEEARTLPWGYGKTRVTAMFVDADRLFTYWEVTDPAIAGARAGLGLAGRAPGSASACTT